jgi:hypothetical protein
VTVIVSSPEGTEVGLRSGALHERAAWLRADLDPSSSVFRAARLLLTACEVGQGVHKLALVTRFAPEFVARCARRLVDNGVWQDGVTVSPWAVSETEEAAFWADVGVAEGRLYRRVNAEGNLEWAPPGQWWKEVHYVTTAGSYGPPTRYYAPTLPAIADDSPHQFLSQESDEAGPVAPRMALVAREEPTSRPYGAPSARPALGEVVVGSPALFGNAVWLT